MSNCTNLDRNPAMYCTACYQELKAENKQLKEAMEIMAIRTGLTSSVVPEEHRIDRKKVSDLIKLPAIYARLNDDLHGEVEKLRARNKELEKTND